MREETLVGPSGNVRYWTSGKSEDCLVFTHGAAMDHRLFAPQVEYFSRSSNVIVWDAPAHGQSRPYAPFSLDDAADRLATILDAENVAMAHLIGQSMGGYIAQRFGEKYPGRVRSITAVGSSPLRSIYYSGFDRWLLSITPGLLKLVPHSYLAKAIANQVAITQSARDYALATLQTYSKEEISIIMRGVYEAVRSCGNQAITVPALLIIHGDRDQTGKVQSYCARWSELEGWPLEIIKDSAHNCNMDNPVEFNRTLDAFLKSI